MMMDQTTTSETTLVQETSTSTYTTANYGSGSSYWGGSGYDNCVNQCMASYGGMTMGGTYQATATAGSAGSTGTGATVTVLVGPTAGAYRFMPFAVNASVGDTIEFHWGASNHTVTKSSALLPCNKSAENPVFASGEQQDGFIFSQVVNTTETTYYYCGTPTHCEKGMFGIINPPQATPGSPNSLAVMLSTLASNDSDLAAYAAYSSNLTANNLAASSWADNLDISVLPQWAQGLAAASALFTRATLGMNSEIISSDGSVDLSSVQNTPLMLPMDITNALANGAAAASTSATDVPSEAAATSAESAASSKPTSGAVTVTSSRLLVAAFVVVATFFAL